MTRKCYVFFGLGVLIFALGFPVYVGSQEFCHPPGEKKEKERMIEWGPEASGMRCAVAVSAGPSKIPTGNPLTVQLLTKNVSTKVVDIVHEDELLSIYKMQVDGPNGKPAAFTAYGRMEGPAFGSTILGKLKPGEERKDLFLLSRVFDITVAGEYKISFSRLGGYTGDKKWVEVPSNILTITVVD